jgi:hypothetical protein
VPLKCSPSTTPLRYTLSHFKFSTQKPPTSTAETIVLEGFEKAKRKMSNLLKLLASQLIVFSGIGIPMMAANYISGITVTLQSENGILGLVSVSFRSDQITE